MIIGHQRILEFLRKSIENNRLAHAYLFTGAANLGKRAVALEFIKMLNGQEIEKAIHPDILIVEPETVERDGSLKEFEIGIRQAREIQRQMTLYPYQSDYKITLIDQADRMSPEASNCLLKTLEEPSGKAVLILVTSNWRMILPTIASRCQQINFLPVPEEEIKKGLSKVFGSLGHKYSLVVRLANGRPGLAIRYLENPELLKNQEEIISQLEKLLRADLNERYQYAEKIAKDIPLARQILDTWIFWFRDLLLLKNNCSDLTVHPTAVRYQNSYSLLKLKNIIKAIKRTNWFLANPSINARLALEVLMLEF
jgi:DNA polymerase-3 subunit delta'